METIKKLKEPSAQWVSGFLHSLQAAMGVPFLLTFVANLRHWSGWVFFRNPR